MQIESEAGLPDFEEAATAVEHAAEVMRVFAASAHLYEGLDEKERGPADELPYIVTAALVAAWKLDASRSLKHLLQVSAVLPVLIQALASNQHRCHACPGTRECHGCIYVVLYLYGKESWTVMVWSEESSPRILGTVLCTVLVSRGNIETTCLNNVTLDTDLALITCDFC